MLPIVTDGVAWSVCLSVGLSVCHDREPYKMAEPIVMLFGMLTRVGPRNHVFDGGPDPHMGRGNFEGVKGPTRTCPDMSGDRYTESDSAGGSTGMVQMPTGVTRWRCTLTTWRIRLNRPCAAAMRPYVKLL